MEWISSWIQGIIIAVIIGAIIEMILPEGNSKKYIKVVIGVYIMFSVVSPVISKISGNEFKVSDKFDLEKYVEVSASESKQDLQISQDEQIKQLYIDTLKKDMKEKIKTKGHNTKNIEIDVNNDENYSINSVTISLTEKEETNNEIEIVNEIKIEIAQTEEEKEVVTATISNSEKNELKEYLSSVYELDITKININ